MIRAYLGLAQGEGHSNLTSQAKRINVGETPKSNLSITIKIAGSANFSAMRLKNSLL